MLRWDTGCARIIPEILSPKGEIGRKQIETSAFIDKLHCLTLLSSHKHRPRAYIFFCYRLIATDTSSTHGPSRAVLHRVDNPTLRPQRTSPLDLQVGGRTSIASSTNSPLASL